MVTRRAETDEDQQTEKTSKSNSDVQSMEQWDHNPFVHDLYQSPVTLT
jgi:hypothetical protein